MFPKAISGESAWLATLWAKRERLKDKPVRIVWGLKAPALSTRELECWKSALPNHEAQTFLKGGHVVAEEWGPDLISPIESFLKANP